MLKAIETRYKGYRFRSRLEARWAVFFDALGVPWDYEKEGYDLGDAGRYLPDFWLPSVGLRGEKTTGLWVEIKPVAPSESEEYKCEALAAQSRQPVIVFVGVPPGDGKSDAGYEFSQGWDNYMRFLRCYNPKCGYIKIDYAVESNHHFCPRCQSHADDGHPIIDRAIVAARSARFEYGEHP